MEKTQGVASLKEEHRRRGSRSPSKSPRSVMKSKSRGPPKTANRSGITSPTSDLQRTMISGSKAGERVSFLRGQQEQANSKANLAANINNMFHQYMKDDQRSARVTSR